MSSQPLLLRKAALVALNVSVGDASEHTVVVPYPTKSITFPPLGQPVKVAVSLTNATLAFLPDIDIVGEDT